MKPDAIAFFRLYDRLKTILPAVARQTGCVLLSDRNFENLDMPKDRLLITTDLVDSRAAALRAREAASKRSSSVVSFFLDNMDKLHRSSELLPSDRAIFEQRIVLGLESFYASRFMFEEILAKFEVRCVVLSPSYIDRQRAIIELANEREITTIHLQHGSWISSELHHPESADILALADHFGESISIRYQKTDTMRVVTGLPFSNLGEGQILDSEFDRNRKRESRLALGIGEDTNVVTFFCPFMEGLYLPTACLGYRLVEQIEILLAAAKERTSEGKRTLIIVRQNPHLLDRQSSEAVMSIAEDLECPDLLRVINDQPELVFDASDIIVPAAPPSSITLDAFAQGRPVVSYAILPSSVRNESCYAVVSRYCYVAEDADEFKREIFRLLDDEHYWAQRQKDAYNFIRGFRPYNAEQGLENVTRLIVNTAKKGVGQASDC